VNALSAGDAWKGSLLGRDVSVALERGSEWHRFVFLMDSEGWKKWERKKIGGLKDEPNSDHGSSWPHQNNADHHEPSMNHLETSQNFNRPARTKKLTKKLTKKIPSKPFTIHHANISHFHQHSSENH
jgi:hypothetical protein